MTARRVCSNFQRHLLKPRLKTAGATGPQNYGNKVTILVRPNYEPRSLVGLSGFHHPAKKVLKDLTTAPQPPLLALLVDHFRHLITEMNGDRFFIADPCHSEPDCSAKDANSSQKETPAEGRGSKTSLGSVTLFPPREAFFLTRQASLLNWHRDSRGWTACRLSSVSFLSSAISITPPVVGF